MARDAMRKLYQYKYDGEQPCWQNFYDEYKETIDDMKVVGLGQFAHEFHNIREDIVDQLKVDILVMDFHREVILQEFWWPWQALDEFSLWSARNL